MVVPFLWAFTPGVMASTKARAARVRRSGVVRIDLIPLLSDFEDDIEFYRHPERKAGDPDDQPNGCFLDAKDVSEKV
jgi:hypothetical protein